MSVGHHHTYDAGRVSGGSSFNGNIRSRNPGHGLRMRPLNQVNDVLKH